MVGEASNHNEVAKTLNPIRTIWALEALYSAEIRTGVALVGPISAATALRRATVFAIAALQAHPLFRAEPSSADRSFAKYLLHARCRELLAICGINVPGLLAALDRTEGEPFEAPADYVVLFQLLSNEGSKPRGRALRHVRPLTSGAIHAVSTVALSLLNPSFLASMRSREDACEVNEILNFVQSRCSKEISATMVEQCSGRNRRGKRGWAARVLLRYGDRFPEPPVKSDDFFDYLNGMKIGRVAKRFQNCLRSRIIEAAAGTCAFYEVATSPISIVELRRIDIGNHTQQTWVFHEVYVERNGLVPNEVQNQVEAYLSKHQIGKLSNPAAPDVVEEVARYFQLGDRLGLM